MQTGSRADRHTYMHIGRKESYRQVLYRQTGKDIYRQANLQVSR